MVRSQGAGVRSQRAGDVFWDKTSLEQVADNLRSLSHKETLSHTKLLHSELAYPFLLSFREHESYLNERRAPSNSVFSLLVPMVIRRHSLQRVTRVRLRTMMPLSTR